MPLLPSVERRRQFGDERQHVAPGERHHHGFTLAVREFKGSAIAISEAQVDVAAARQFDLLIYGKHGFLLCRPAMQTPCQSDAPRLKSTQQPLYPFTGTM